MYRSITPGKLLTLPGSQGRNRCRKTAAGKTA